MGMSFLQYVNEVRISHIYQDLIRTDIPVGELADQNGFSNQKLFNRTFKEIYGCTPSSVRINNLIWRYLYYEDRISGRRITRQRR